MQKEKYLLLSLVSFIVIVFCTIIKNGDFVSALSVTGRTDIVSGVNVLQANGNDSSGHALFKVDLTCVNGVDCKTEKPNKWSCWLHGASDALAPSLIDEIHVDPNCTTNNKGTRELCTVYLIPTGYKGSRNFGASTDTCTSNTRGGSAHPSWCDDWQSVKGTVSVPVTCTANYVEIQKPAGSSTSTADHYLSIKYLKYGTENTIQNTCGAPTSIGPYRVTTTTNYYDIYSHDQNNCGGADTYLRAGPTVTTTNPNPPSQASVSPSATLCDGKYRYVSASPSTGPFSMNTSRSVNLYYAEKHTLTLKHVDYYNKNGNVITNDQTASRYDDDKNKDVTINPVSNNFSYGGYTYQLYGYAATRNDTITPNSRTSYTEKNLTSDVTRWAFYKKVLYLTIIPVDTNGNRLANNRVARALEGDSASVKTDTMIGNYTFKGFGADWHNPSFPSSYIYTFSEMHNHVNIYAVYETSDDLSSACPPQNGNLVQTYVKNTRFEDGWNREITYAKPGDKVSFCTGYNNKYPYWNFMYPDYDYLISYGSYANPGRALPLGYRGSALNNQLYTGFTVTSNRSDYGLQYTDNPQLRFTNNYNDQQKRTEQQNNFKSTKRAIIKDYPNSNEKIDNRTFSANTPAAIKFNTNNKDIGSSVTEQGFINDNATTSSNTYTSVSYIKDKSPSTGSFIVESNTFDHTTKDQKEKGNTAKAIYPYNFQSNITINREEGYYVYTGGTTKLNIDLNVNKKYNAATQAEYATVNEADIHYRIEVTAKNDKGQYIPLDGTKYRAETDAIPYKVAINPENNPEGDKKNIEKTPQDFNIPDLEPGSQVCFRASIWPKDSGADTNTDKNGGYGDTNNSNGWSNWSSEVCYPVASKPSLQAWGGNIIANGQISTSYVEKNHLYPNPYYPLGSYSEAHYFGSWGELGIIANQNTLHMASGAALAYPNGLKTSSTSNNTFMTNFVPLTFANYDPLTGNIIFGNLNKSYTTGEQTFDKNALVSKYIYNTSANIENSISLNQDTVNRDINNPNIYHSDNNVYYYRSDSNLTIGTSNLVRNATQVIHAKNKNIRISGNITYEDGYTTLENIPKLIIYAEDGTISIDWQVARIDAILIADTIITCSTDSGCTLPADAPKANDGSSVLITNPNNRHQLTINGTLIAKKVIPNRTYGAGRGANNTYNDGTINSITPAEIINYDSSLYRWEQYSRQSNEGISPDASLITTYIKEVAPRY